MDVLALNPRNGCLAWGGWKEQERRMMATRQRCPWRSFFGVEDRKSMLLGVLKVMFSDSRGHKSLIVRAAGKRKNPENPSSGNNDSSTGGDDAEQTNKDHLESKSDDFIMMPNSNLSDWRDFRATLVAREQVNLLDPVDPTHDKASSDFLPHSPKWAHPLQVPETGCILVATEKLDGVRSFERTVILLLRLGTRDPQEGPFGVILNRPLHKMIKHMKPSNQDLASTFPDCSLYFGGPLEASMFLLKAVEGSPLPGLEQVIPGICFGSRNSLHEAATMVKKGVLRPQDFRFFVGYAGWQLDQLREEIESHYWVVAACSSQLIAGATADSCSGLWEEILQLMGGKYSELSKKPKQDGP
ncbi:hypothetical protein AXF42_Ash019045 [Apostasia shenzhenica]|uniref:Uncharacterized protein n=1 Tax=Apostasia shenzhenica TaxID=1088818 RepID=A0A2I0BB60_9ASPA|nr:hypothetical protein AXF42_Ash019045 [Apostasia shenzhenica]